MKVVVCEDGTVYDFDDALSSAEIARRIGHDLWRLEETKPLPPAEITAPQLAVRLGRFAETEVIVQVVDDDGETHLHKVVGLQGSPGRQDATLVAVPLLILGPEIQRVDW